MTTCVLCEAKGDIVKAITTIEFNGDMIPVCDRHLKLINKKNSKPFLK